MQEHWEEDGTLDAMRQKGIIPPREEPRRRNRHRQEPPAREQQQRPARQPATPGKLPEPLSWAEAFRQELQEAAGFPKQAAGDAFNAGKAVIRGGGEAINETSRFVASFFSDKHLNDIKGIIPKELLPEEQGGAFGVIEGLSQFMVDWAGAGKIIKPIHLAKRGYTVMRRMGLSRVKAVKAARWIVPNVAGALADAIAFNPYEPRIANWLAELGQTPEEAEKVLRSWQENPIEIPLDEQDDDKDRFDL